MYDSEPGVVLEFWNSRQNRIKGLQKLDNCDISCV